MTTTPTRDLSQRTRGRLAPNSGAGRLFFLPWVYDLLDRAGLNLVEYAPEFRLFYSLKVLFQSSPRLRALAQRLPQRQQQAIAEIAWGFLGKHTFWVSRDTATVANMYDPENVPYFTQLGRKLGVLATLLKETGPVWQCDVRYGGVDVAATVHIEMNDVTRSLVRSIDGQRTMGQIVSHIVARCPQAGPEEAVWKTCCEALDRLRSFDLLLLRHVSVPAIGCWQKLFKPKCLCGVELTTRLACRRRRCGRCGSRRLR